MSKDTVLPAIQLSNPITEVEKWGDFAAKSGVIPPGCNKFQASAIVQTGKEMGLLPMQSLRSMTFVKGRLCMYVELKLALARRGGVKIKEIDEGPEYAKVTLSRDGEEVGIRYTLDMAKRAGLITVGGAWEKYGPAMLRWRSIGDGLRLLASDLGLGMLDNIEAESIDVSPPPAASPSAAGELSAPAASSPATEPAPEGEKTPAPVTAPAEAPPPPGTLLPLDPEFVAQRDDTFAKAKERLGQPAYGIVLKEFGLKSSKEIVDPKQANAIYRKMKQKMKEAEG